MIARNPLTEEQFREATGVPGPGATSVSPSESAPRRGRHWTSTACGAAPGLGRRLLFPPKQAPSFSSRLVGNQDPHKIFRLIKDYIESIAPPSVSVEVRC